MVLLLMHCAHLEMEREVGAREGEGELAGLEIGNLLEHLVLKKNFLMIPFQNVKGYLVKEEDGEDMA